ncbi:MAG: hypothetical protein R3C40_10790 [Parvularculaceae bacterium]
MSPCPSFQIFPACPAKEASEHHRSGIIIGPTVDYLGRAYLDARRDGWSREPIIGCYCRQPWTTALRPPAITSPACSASNLRLNLPTVHRGTITAKKRHAIIDTVSKYAPNFKSSVIAHQIHSPLDLERKFGLTGGDIMHGRLSLDQMFSSRPQPMYADRMPIKGLYLCGSGAHPGGSVTGAPGHNAARSIIADFKARRKFRVSRDHRDQQSSIAGAPIRLPGVFRQRRFSPRAFRRRPIPGGAPMRPAGNLYAHFAGSAPSKATRQKA